MRLMRQPHLQNHAWGLLWAGCMQLDVSDCHENLILSEIMQRSSLSFRLSKPQGILPGMQHTMTRCMPGRLELS